MTAAPAVPAHIAVVAGALLDAGRRVLIAQRPPGKPLAGAWEFPGGKLRAGESETQALARELAEELGVRLLASRHVASTVHAYPERTVHLSLYLVERWSGEVRALEAQALKWVDAGNLPGEPLLEADRPLVAALLRLLGAQPG